MSDYLDIKIRREKPTKVVVDKSFTISGDMRPGDRSAYRNHLKSQPLSSFVPAFLDYLTAEGRDPKTVAEHRRMLGMVCRALGSKPVAELTLTDRALVMREGRKHGENGEQRAVHSWRMMLKYIQQLNVFIPFDYRDIKLPKVPRKPVEYLTEDEIDRIRSQIDIRSISGLRMRALMELMLETGLRIAEACSLNKQDVNEKDREIVFTNCKTREINTVFISDNSVYWLKEYLSKRRDKDPALFMSGRGRLLPVTSRNLLRQIAKRCGINKHIKHHLFRKTYVTTLLRNAVDVRTTQDLARHKDPKTTLKYYAAVTKEYSKQKHSDVFGKAH